MVQWVKDRNLLAVIAAVALVGLLLETIIVAAWVAKAIGWLLLICALAYVLIDWVTRIQKRH